MKEKKVTNTIYKCDYCNHTDTNKFKLSQHESDCKTKVWQNPLRFNKESKIEILEKFCKFQHQKVFYTDQIEKFESIMKKMSRCWNRFDVIDHTDMHITLSGTNAMDIAEFITSIVQQLKPDEISMVKPRVMRIWFD